MSNLPSHLPLESKDCFPVFLCNVFDQLHFVQNQMPPSSLQKMALVFHQQLVGCQAHMEAVWFLPPLQSNEKKKKMSPHLKPLISHVFKFHKITILLDLRSFLLPRYRRILRPGHQRLNSSSQLNNLHVLTTIRWGPQMPVDKNRHYLYMLYSLRKKEVLNNNITCIFQLQHTLLAC